MFYQQKLASHQFSSLSGRIHAVDGLIVGVAAATGEEAEGATVESGIGTGARAGRGRKRKTGTAVEAETRAEKKRRTETRQTKKSKCGIGF